MSFNANFMTQGSRIAPADNVSRSGNKWVYKDTAATLATMAAANFFDPHGAYLLVGDLIECEGSDGVRTLTVATNATATGGHVTTAGSKRMVAGQITTATATDTVVTGLATVIACGATEDSDPIDNPEWVTATIGDQAGSPAAGSIIVKTWQNTSGSDPTPVAATTFSKKVNWWAYGT